MNPWRGRRVFITGHTGFKGSWLAIWLSTYGAKIRGYSLDPETSPNLFALAEISSVLEDIRGDIRHYSKLEASMKEFAPEVVFHLAAQPLLRRSYAQPLETYSTNIIGTADVLEAVRHVPSVRAVVCVSSDKCYENAEGDFPFRETDPLGGHDPYSSSKACAEIVTSAYRRSFFPVNRLHEHRVAVATARAGNVIGGGDWSEDRLLPDLIRGFRARQAVLIRRPEATRPWQHVLDPLHGYILLAEKLLAQQPQFATAFNFGPPPEDAWSVERVATALADLWGKGAAWKSDGGPSPHEARTLRLDASKANAELGWKPHLRIETALDWTLNWYLSWDRGDDLKQKTLAQIAAYQQLA
ncbi:MAG: CDP-glucose 4,6-dehydratase [Acidobacteriota bacterium]|nr:CDP-glucose 4,6-dehydratase [Acidobacteriota bacterium]